MRKENRTILKVVTWLLVTLVLWLTYYCGCVTKSLSDFGVKMILLVTVLCPMMIGYVIANEK